ncbi:hypothetical protein VaNZ11_000841 [Volvox africanus]|uniref:Biotin-protein ligase N-terminal domain-containing protein n=1 Tax=Volvox africanus TaxID=51714 RepID=A0ABQ5RPI4_9CHLO|nr:hypothetical protein VaNZ11_000841 [Volvox africanus]
MALPLTPSDRRLTYTLKHPQNWRIKDCIAFLRPCPRPQRKRAAPMPGKAMPVPHVKAHDPAPLEVLVYCGEGAGYQSARNTLRALQSCLAPGVEARLLGTNELLEGSWRGRCLLFVMPGGADLPYCKHLNGHGNRLLRGYVAGGGSYLGICAGAYYACRRVAFEPGGPLEVIGDRELGFFPGTARGAAYPGFDYSSERGACAAPLRFRPLPPARQSASTLAGGSSGVSSGGSGDESYSKAGGIKGGDDVIMTADVAPPRLSPYHLVLQAGDGAGSTDGEYDRWVYCRDYSNGGPVFVLDAQPAPATKVVLSPPPSEQQQQLEGRVFEASSAPTTAASCGGAAAAASSRAGNGGGGDTEDWPPAPSWNIPSASAERVEALAIYPELGNALAAVRCRVGGGVAVLCGTHPEMPHEALSISVQLYDGQQAQHVSALGAELMKWEMQRRQLWAALLAACCVVMAAPKGMVVVGMAKEARGAAS